MTPYFNNLTDLITMNGHGVYVWLCYGITFACLLLLIGYIKRERKQAIVKLTGASTSRLTNKQRRELADTE